ncbi:MAG: hypothetical protein WAM91_16940 [Candidatus Acidiferrales bacterium]
MPYTTIAGLVGDLLTFVGGLMLTLDAAHKDEEFEKINNVAKALNSPWMARLKVDMEGIIITDEKDVQHAFIRRSARKAVWGCRILCIGFGLLLLSRALELMKHP